MTQDRNLLYIAVTRASESLTFLLTDNTMHVASPYLPLDLIHYAGNLWPDDTDDDATTTPTPSPPGCTQCPEDPGP